MRLRLAGCLAAAALSGGAFAWNGPFTLNFRLVETVQAQSESEIRAEADRFVKKYIDGAEESERAEAEELMRDNYDSFLQQLRQRGGEKNAWTCQLAVSEGRWILRQTSAQGVVRATVYNGDEWWLIDADRLLILEAPSLFATPLFPWLGADLPGLEFVNSEGMVLPEARGDRQLVRIAAQITETPKGRRAEMQTTHGARRFEYESEGKGPQGIAAAGSSGVHPSGRPWSWTASSFVHKPSADESWWVLSTHLREGMLVVAPDGASVNYEKAKGSLADQLALSREREAQRADAERASQGRIYGMLSAIFLGAGACLFLIWRRRPRQLAS